MIVCLVILNILLVCKILIMRRSAKEITEEIQDRLTTDTNTPITITSHDRRMRELAIHMNRQLKDLRKEYLQYHQGNTELKTAITNMSHDIRTPLTAIIGNLYMIRKTDDISEIKEYLSAIEERTESMKQLTEELFRYSVIVSEDVETVTEEVYVNQVLAESIGSFYPVLTEKGITPNINISDARVIRIINKSDLTRVFSNLLNNAVKYSDGDLDITLSEDGKITFANTAKELSSVQVEQLFDRFYTVEAAHHSTGLGLSIARTLVERMGGTITADYDNSRLTIKITL
ncbi:MAG: HAMP domain-containing histidine kinase [Ruminococcus sp.]|uniref:sensor histidine kinase n=1 Tax=Ruminococcus sp. TaxID=41978 RepID=UPI0025E578A9|nr:HAMP domain-containing sensor histidine kinase [Ruminococcus sp.]MBO4867870.1 HAMP domain-containing histidine kinase [Ruminococcus sp.]